MQNPCTDKSTLASTVVFEVLQWWVSPVSRFNCGSHHISWQISDNCLAVKFLSLLCRNVMKPHFLPEKTCSRLNIWPRTHIYGKYFSGIP